MVAKRILRLVLPFRFDGCSAISKMNSNAAPVVLSGAGKGLLSRQLLQ